MYLATVATGIVNGFGLFGFVVLGSVAWFSDQTHLMIVSLGRVTAITEIVVFADGTLPSVSNDRFPALVEVVRIKLERTENNSLCTRRRLFLRVQVRPPLLHPGQAYRKICRQQLPPSQVASMRQTW